MDAHRLTAEPFYRPIGDERRLAEAAYARRVPLLLTGPSGCGKTRFVEHLAWRLARPLITVACHEDLTAADLTGRWLLEGHGTRWQDGPLAAAARSGAICYLDELFEARPDTTVAIHPLTDTRRLLPLDRAGEILHAHPEFFLIASANPSVSAQVLKPSTRQRFAAIAFTYPPPEVEAAIVAQEAGCPLAVATRLVTYGHRTRRLGSSGLQDGASTRMLVHAGALVAQGLSLLEAATMAIALPLSEDLEVREALLMALDVCR